MKKILIVLCFATVFIICFSAVCFAMEVEGVPETEIFAVADAVADETENHTIFTRLWEFVNQYSGETLTLIGDFALVILAVIVKIKNSKGTKQINVALDNIKQETGLNLSNQSEVVAVVNNLIDSYNAQTVEYERLKEAYEKYGATELDRNKVIGALAMEISTVLDILSTVYVNNKNLPQGVKDLVNIKYANCLKTLENDEELAAVVNSVRLAIGVGKTVNAEEKIDLENTGA